MKKWRLAVSFALVSIMMGSTGFAGQWISDAHGWWYNNGDGTWPVSTWQWIDGNGDSIAECYYFDANGYMLANANTPDSYAVNADGAWVLNGTVQTKYVGAVNVEPEGEAEACASSKTSANSSASGQKKLTATNGKTNTITYLDTYSDAFFENEYNDSSVESEEAEDADLEAYAQECFELVNKKRKAAGVSELEWDSTLAEACDIRAAELAERFSHLRPDGELCFTVFDEVGIELSGKAENILVGSSTAKGAVSRWMNSKGHKKNILSKSMKRSAVGVYYDSDSKDYYWVQLFGRKRNE